MISKSEILSLGWEQMINNFDFPVDAYILYHTDYVEGENENFTTLTLKKDEYWLMIHKQVNTYFGRIANSTELQTLMTDFDIP